MTEPSETTPEKTGSKVVNFHELKEGNHDPNLNKTIRTLISREENFIVYLDEELFVEWATNDRYGQPLDGFGEVLNKVGYLESLSEALIPARYLAPFRRLLGESVARILGEKDAEEAQQILDTAEKYLKTRGAERARLWYLSSSFVVALVGGLSVATVWVWLSMTATELEGSGFEVLVATALGAWGAFLSVITRSRTLEVDPSAGPTIPYVEGAIRVIVGALGALLVVLAIKANLVLGFVNTVTRGLPLLAVMGFVSGASERLVPNIIRRVEESLILQPKEIRQRRSTPIA